MTEQEAAAFAQDWVAAWNARGLPRILAHYTEDITFLSPKAARLTGDGTVSGKAALAAYWGAALAQTPDLRFTLTGWRLGWNALTILYTNQQGIAVAESMEFAPDGRVMRSMACYAAAGSATGPAAG